MTTKTHHFFMLLPSPWPLVCSLSGFNLLFSGILFFKFNEGSVLIFNLFNLIFLSFCWWIFYGEEFVMEGKESSTLEEGVKSAMILFILSEILFFFSFFWSYFHFFLSPCLDTGLVWPPYMLQFFDCLSVPLINTFVLMLSGATVTASHYFLTKFNMFMANYLLMITIVLGAFFSMLQLMEYKSAFFSLSDSTFGTSFFILTGFHGLHVLIGTFFLMTSLFRASKLNFSKVPCLNFELSSWYWHFVDVVWIFLYFLIYYLNN